MLQAPLPNSIFATPGVPPIIPQVEVDPDPTGLLNLYQPAGPTLTATNAFFQSLGSNGRSCATCHQAANGFGLSVASVQSRYKSSFGRDPLFAPVDGATCPKNVTASATAGSIIGGLFGAGPSAPALSPYYALLNKGLIRIPIAVPKGAEFTVQVVTDPFGCNTSPQYDQVVNSDGSTSQVLSLYRRPLISANLKFKVQSAANSGLFPPVEPIDGSPLPRDARGNIENGNIMWDGREPTLSSQAIDATLSHAQAVTAPTAAQVAQMVAFESGVFSAQTFDNAAGPLTAFGAQGCASCVANLATGTFAPANPVMTLYNNWSGFGGVAASVYRGQQIFNNKLIVINNVAGFNNVVGQGFPGHCSTCHGQTNAGYDPLPVAQHDIGVGGSDSNLGGPLPANDLPVFLLTCTGGATTPYNTGKVLTNDPGKALVTGKCADIGRMTVPGLRAMAGHAPYFSDGSAPGLTDVVNFYNRRFTIGFSAQETTDLVNFLNTL